MTDPILGRKELDAGAFGYPYPITIYAMGGLHYLKGNSQPHFSLTGEVRSKGRGCEAIGTMAGQLLEHFPHLEPLARLHLSDMDGTPMHAEANGWYWLAGALDGLGEQFHGGNGNPPRSRSDCLDIFAKHVRLSRAQAKELAEEVRHATPSLRRARFKAWVEDQRPRWKQEAEEVREALKLQVYGDPWNN